MQARAAPTLTRCPVNVPENRTCPSGTKLDMRSRRPAMADIGKPFAIAFPKVDRSGRVPRRA